MSRTRILPNPTPSAAYRKDSRLGVGCRFGLCYAYQIRLGPRDRPGATIKRIHQSMLDKIMKPRSVAVVGASTKQHTIGSDIMKRLQEYGFNGPIYPVNPKGGVIEGLPAYQSVLDIPGDVDLAIIIVNSRFVLQTIDQCH